MIRFKAPVPPSVNEMYRKAGRGRGMYMTPKAQAWKQEAMLAAIAAGGQIIDGPVQVVLKLNTKRGDVDNRAKPTLDMAEGVFYANDSAVDRLLIERTSSRTQDCEIAVGPYDTAELILLMLRDAGAEPPADVEAWIREACKPKAKQARKAA